MKRTKRQQFGQHYLRDQKVIRSIVERTISELDRWGCRTLLEVGPGDGALTLPICSQLNELNVSKYRIAERDRELIAKWSAYFEVDSKIKKEVELIEGDFVEVDSERFIDSSEKTGVVSNLPYSAGTAIILKLIEFPSSIPFMVLMVQAEVGERLRADPDSKAWGSLSLWVQNTWKVERMLKVPPGAFAPPPKVDSEVLVFYPREKPLIDGTGSGEVRVLLNALVRDAFAHRRKMLRSTLGRVSRWQKALVAANLDGTKRAEALTWDEWRQLFSAVQYERHS